MRKTSRAYNPRCHLNRTPLESHKRWIFVLVDVIPGLAGPAVRTARSSLLTSDGATTRVLSSDEFLGSGWKATVHPGRPPILEEKWESSAIPNLDMNARYGCNAPMASFTGFVLRRDRYRNETGAVVRWYGTGIDIEEGTRRELLRAAEKRTLQMIADGASLTDILNHLCSFH